MKQNVLLEFSCPFHKTLCVFARLPKRIILFFLEKATLDLFYKKRTNSLSIFTPLRKLLNKFNSFQYKNATCFLQYQLCSLSLCTLLTSKSIKNTGFVISARIPVLFSLDLVPSSDTAFSDI